ncbi:hypothetical protein ABT373_11105 [Streptomyces sp. NPDC000070]|uniref:hypothetical protein n=1 Tax=Streptomyces sp. NPDC000070 TaxID=3154240 RepID=UPI003330A8D9
MTVGTGEALPGPAAALAAVATATAQARRRLGIAVDDQAPGRVSAASVPVAGGSGRRPPRPRGFGRGFRGIRTDR